MLQKMLCVAAAILMLSGCAEKEPNTPDVLVPAVMVEGQVYCTTGEEFPGEVEALCWARFPPSCRSANGRKRRARPTSAKPARPMLGRRTGLSCWSIRNGRCLSPKSKRKKALSLPGNCKDSAFCFFSCPSVPDRARAPARNSCAASAFLPRRRAPARCTSGCARDGGRACGF